MEWVMPTHIVAAAGVVTNEKDEVLLVKTYQRGWTFPGGQIEVGENLIDGVRREIMEESGIDAEVGEVFCISSNTKKYAGHSGVREVPTKVMLDFICRAVGGEARPSDENSETAWFTKEAALEAITTPAEHQRFLAYLEYSGRPTYLEYVTRPEFVLKLKRTI